MKVIGSEQITKAVASLCREAALSLPDDVRRALERCRDQEESRLGREILDRLLENADIAARERIPVCQDTGLAAVFVNLGRDVRLTGDLQAAINVGIRQGYEEGFLRRSMVEEPLFTRRNTGDNTPAMIHVDVVEGDRLAITLLPKGAGSENMSALRMLRPADGAEGLKQFVLETVVAAGASACPPLLVGVGVGGSFDCCPLLAKRALLRPVGNPHPEPRYAQLERELLEAINDTGIGPGGFGGRCTAMAVHLLRSPCHIASLPVAVNLQCHAARRRSVSL